MMMEDIEDLTAPAAPARVARGVRVKPVVAREPTPSERAAAACECVPGTESIYVKTYGCSHNASDSEYMCGLLSQYGYRLVGEEQRASADLWLINSCTVKNPSQEHLATDISRAQGLSKPVVVAGCVSQAEPTLGALQGISLVGVQQIDQVVLVVREALAGNVVRLLERRRRDLPALDLPKARTPPPRTPTPVAAHDAPRAQVRRNPLVEIIPINTGCLGSCTYCKTVYARGRLGSYEPGVLLKRARDAFADGVKEIWLTSEDSGAYGRDIGTSLPALLAAMLDEVPRGCMLRVGMTNPPYILQHLDALAPLLNHPRCYAFLHVPVQSGSDAVLGNMRREYTVAEFRRVADAMIAAVPHITLSTDIISGFPGETEADHQSTVRLVRHYRFPILNISQFYPRPGTPAARMTRVPTHVVKERTRELTALFRSYLPYEHLLGAVVEVLVTEVSSRGDRLAGHSKGYVQVRRASLSLPRPRGLLRACVGREGDSHAPSPVQVLLPRADGLMGALVRARVTGTSKWHVAGEVVEVLVPPTMASADSENLAPNAEVEPAACAETASCAGGLCAAPERGPPPPVDAPTPPQEQQQPGEKWEGEQQQTRTVDSACLSTWRRALTLRAFDLVATCHLVGRWLCTQRRARLMPTTARVAHVPRLAPLAGVAAAAAMLTAGAAVVRRWRS